MEKRPVNIWAGIGQLRNGDAEACAEYYRKAWLATGGAVGELGEALAQVAGGESERFGELVMAFIATRPEKRTSPGES